MISAWLLFAGGRSHSLMPVAQFNPFEGLDRPIMEAGGTDAAYRLCNSSPRSGIVTATSWSDAQNRAHLRHEITQFKSLAVALKELEPFVRNGQHLQTGKPFNKLGGMRSREVLVNWLVCAAANVATEGELTFCSDPTGGDGIIRDVKTGETWPTEHVMVPRLRPGVLQ